MEISVSQAQAKVPVTVLHIKGDLSAEEPLLSRAEEAHQSGARNILIDLSESDYMSSAGLRAIHAMFELLRSSSPQESQDAIKKGISAGTFTSPHLKLLKPNKHISDVLKTAGYDMFLEIYQDYNKAIASYG